LHFEGADTPTALLLHAAAASAAFATLENVFYLNFRAADAGGGVPLVTLLMRCLLGVPSHIAEGVMSAAGLALHHFSGDLGAGGAPPLTWAVLGRILLPAVLLHGLWDFFIFIFINLRTVAVARCERVLSGLAPPPPAAGVAPSSSDYYYDDYATTKVVLQACSDLGADAGRKVVDLLVSLNALDICNLVSAIVLPVATAYVCRRLVLEVRALEARLCTPGWTPPPVTPADAEAGGPFGGSSAARSEPPALHRVAPARSYEAAPAPAPAAIAPGSERPQQRPDQ
jgi:hypothetical protein